MTDHRAARRQHKDMAFQQLLQRSPPHATGGMPRNDTPSLPPATRATTPPHQTADMDQSNTPTPPSSSPSPRLDSAFATPPHLKTPTERRAYTSPFQAANNNYRLNSSPTAGIRRQTVNGSARPRAERKLASAIPPFNTFQNGKTRGIDSSSSSSGENRPFGPPRRPRMQGNGNYHGPRNSRINMPLNQQLAKNALELKIWAVGFPAYCTALDVYNAFSCLGSISRIEVKNLHSFGKGANITFRPAPPDTSWVGMKFKYPDAASNIRWIETKDETPPPYMHTSQTTGKKLPDRIQIPVNDIDFGVMESESTMLGMHSLQSTARIQASLMMDLSCKALFLTFPVRMASKTQEIHECEFRMRLIPAQIRDGRMTTEEDSSISLYFTCETPPVVHRKTLKPQQTFKDKDAQWDDRALWFRQTLIELNPSIAKSSVKLREKECIVDLGRWLTYRLNISQETFQSPGCKDLWQALADHNVKIAMDEDTNFNAGHVEDFWEWLDTPAPQVVEAEDNPILADMYQMAGDTVHLPFSVRYQLEVCLSLGFLHECNMTKGFLNKLASLDPARGVKILEKVADDKKRYFKPDDIFRLQNRVSIVEKKRPGYCTKIPSAVVTPTTIYFATPVLETSNRVVRQFQHFEDRFLRVKFTDERHKGRLFPQDDRNEDELFTRVLRTMNKGILIGDRHYEFLAFGSSQFREHGAYFFASTSSLTAEMIRLWMGNFTNIKVVAKYCARLGQCFSTTRAIPHSVTIEKIDDIERNGFCFTDGAGKVSPFLARIIAHQFGLKNSEHDHPSAFQFRMGGCKGILEEDPSLKGKTIQIRPSQEKFPAEFQGLEICRISQYSTAYLNQQIILVLSALGVPDDVFVKKLRGMLSEFEEAMVNEQKTLDLLQKNIDYNQMTIALAGMICDGFMEAQEPFMMSCLRLWKSWTLKYLKEKARICVEQGAFVLAGPDETGTLKGDFKAKIALDETDGDELSGDDELPEIFLQIPDPEQPGKHKVIEDVCIIARNPSLHPGDIRKVRAVDAPALRHMKDVLIMPITGNRDLANMCSGGDLDGDDFMVIWDKELFPKEDSHPPMDYTAPEPTLSDGPVTTTDIAKFFVQHIRSDNLARIATAHRYWADQLDDGIKDPKCLELANLHSRAVDYAKTGVPAEIPPELRVKKWPHWAERKNVGRAKIYQSKNVLGKLFDEVKSEPFRAAWDLAPDKRILNACEPTDQMLQDAREVKAAYDESLRRIMTQYGIRTEHEVFTTFVLEHHQDINDYKLAETMGEAAEALCQQHRDLCYEKAGTDSKSKDWEKLKPFIVAMYKVTAEEIAHAYAQTKETVTIGGCQVPRRPLDFAHMPLMSFPWIFRRELGQIATRGGNKTKLEPAPRPSMPKKAAAARKQIFDLLGDEFAPEPLPEVNTSDDAVRQGNRPSTIDLTSTITPLPTAPKPKPKPSPEAWPDSIRDEHLEQATAASVEAENEVMRKARLYQKAGLPSDSFSGRSAASQVGHLSIAERGENVKGKGEGEGGEEDQDENEWEGEEVKIEFDEEPSRLDQLASLVGTGS
ncbi:hypothetical protein M409DRAFT_68778 [Zasmidium cellare ATCC 36951]|uniref:RNA-directed RNA polymerase n=1 Tax=Zasmidium cellare ATCC 36951 TaxID=1080233 RepID=A0A6A6C7V2_ZASCE|nr:uncharacterized protein M409DRAFT_68778 [Zasmidium cellare ATCC 36951]KAF2163184.1 hypothetical protein M409DRAFT_68778 [Zasmidium cellare ATCC 36951]